MQQHTPSSLRLFQTMAGAAHGGAEAFFERLAISFAEAGITQTVSIKPFKDRVERLHSRGVKTLKCEYRPALKFLDSAILARQIKATEANLVLSWMNRASGMVRKGHFTHVGRLGGYYKLKYYQNCDWLVGNTKGITEWLIAQGWPAAKTHTQVNFVEDGSTLSPDKELQKLVPDHTIRIAAMGRLHPNKGFDVLIKALARTADTSLLLAGTGPEEEKLKQLVEQENIADRVVFLGWHPHPQQLIASADIFVCPSRHEPFGNVIAEALATKKPVITTASQGATEFITPDHDGIVTPIDDSDALANAITTLSKDHAFCNQLGAHGYQRYQHSFTQQAVTAAWISFLEDVAS